VKARFLTAAVLMLALAPRLRAGDAADTSAASTDTSTADSGPTPGNITTSWELDADTSYIGAARTDFGSGIDGNVTENRTDSRLVMGVQDNGGPIYRFGLSYQRYSFGFSQAAPIPNLLVAENAVLGVDFTFLSSWLVRIEADPGFYSDGRSFGIRDFNVPFDIGASYIAGEDLQWVVGMEVDLNRQIPVFPAVGFRWAIRDQWVLDAILPTPRLEFDWSKNLTLYIGGDVDDGTYRVDRDFGSALGRTNLNGAIVEYDEVRVGSGLSWKATKAITLELEAGYLPYREFDFHRSDVHFSNEDGAAYTQMSLNAQF
jgi:hypothetical protein